MRGPENRLLQLLSLLVVTGPCIGYYKGAGCSAGLKAGVVRATLHRSMPLCKEGRTVQSPGWSSRTKSSQVTQGCWWQREEASPADSGIELCCFCWLWELRKIIYLLVPHLENDTDGSTSNREASVDGVRWDMQEDWDNTWSQRVLRRC